jgi:phenylpropionate dioxygenase-like ring-hydroxylating dioxygenase large terminal subunit
MLKKEDNELLCRVGPGTPMGGLMRQYWIPAIRSDELPEPDGTPVRIRLLGENLIGYRTTAGAVGLMQDACPHRGASMFFGRNEEEGLRCVYHGWKFDVTGACIDMPNEPAESNFKHKIKATAYRTLERNGIIWAYMGPRETAPSLPDLEATLFNTDPKRISILHRPCNWMQGWEGEMDTVHAAFLHSGASKPEDFKRGEFGFYHYKQRAPRFSVLDTEWGCSYGAYRPAEADSNYWRIAHMLLPFYAMTPTGVFGEEGKLNAYVPMDDENTLEWECVVNMAGKPRRGPGFRGKYLPNTTGWFGRFNIEQNLSNDYLIDREAQRTWKSYTGIEGIRMQDMAVTETMGPIYNRTREHLGTTDVLIIRMRSRMINAAKALRDHGTVPPGVDNPEMYRIRSGEVVIPKSADWWQYTTEARTRFGMQASTAT